MLGSRCVLSTQITAVSGQIVFAVIPIEYRYYHMDSRCLRDSRSYSYGETDTVIQEFITLSLYLPHRYCKLGLTGSDPSWDDYEVAMPTAHFQSAIFGRVVDAKVVSIRKNAH